MVEKGGQSVADFMSGRRSLAPWPPLSEATTASPRRPRPPATFPPSPWPSHPARNHIEHERGRSENDKVRDAWILTLDVGCGAVSSGSGGGGGQPLEGDERQ